MKILHRDNRIVGTATDDYTGPEAWIPAPDGFDVAKLDTYRLVNGQVTDVPYSVTRFQARAALLAAGLLPSVEAAIASADQFTQIAWVDAQEFRRESPTMNALAVVLGLSSAQLDDLFRQAATIEA